MSGSIISNLPAFGTKQVVCKEIYPSDILKRKISCYGVGSLTISVEYFVAFKM